MPFVLHIFFDAQELMLLLRESGNIINGFKLYFGIRSYLRTEKKTWGEEVKYTVRAAYLRMKKRKRIKLCEVYPGR